MTKPVAEKFYTSLNVPIIVLWYSVGMCFLIAVTGTLTIGAIVSFVALEVGCIIVFRIIPAVKITEQGLACPGHLIMEWSDVKTVEKRKILGLEHLKVVRFQGMDAWIPLYLRSHRSIEVALKDLSPQNSPFKNY